MKNYLLIILALMAVMAMSSPLLAGEGNRRDVRDLSYIHASPVVTSSTQLMSMVDNRRDIRDLNYFNSSDMTEVSNEMIAVQGNRRDAKDLAYLPGQSNETIIDEGNKILCCQR